LRQTTSLQLTKYKDGEPILFNDGTWLKTKDSPEIYLISNGTRRMISDPSTFTALGGQSENIIITNEKTLAAHPLGDSIKLTPSLANLTSNN